MIQQLLQTVLTWVESLGPLAALGFIAIYSLAAVLLVPGVLLTVGAGALFGVVWGSIYVFIGASLGAILAFAIGRYLARGWVARQIEGNGQFQAIDRAVAREGLKIVVLTRLSPVLPYTLLNYAFGLTQVNLRDYTLGCLGMIPGTVAYVYIGSLAGDLATMGMAGQALSREATIVQWAIRGVGLLATLAIAFYVARIARRSLQEYEAE